MYLLELAGDDDPFALAEAQAAATGVRSLGPGVALADALDPGRARRLAYTRRASDLVAEGAGGVAAAVEALRAAALDRTGSVAVRARDVQRTADADTRVAERELGQVLVDRGFAVDLDAPDHELRAVFSGERFALGWLTVESDRAYGERAPTDRPFFQPGSMDPLLARALVNLALADASLPEPAPSPRGATDDHASTAARASTGRPRLLDPMCGTGGLPIEAGLVGAHALAADAQWKMVRGAQRNLRQFLPASRFDAFRGDATALPLRDGSVDAVAFDAPYGRQSKVARHDLRDLVAGALAESRRVVRPDGRTVLVADRDWRDAAADAGWRVVDRFERRVHRSLTRQVLVLE